MSQEEREAGKEGGLSCEREVKEGGKEERRGGEGGIEGGRLSYREKVKGWS